MKIIDMHTHVFPEHVEMAVEVMDRCGVDLSVTLEWHDGFGDSLARHLEVFNRHPDRFLVYGNVDFSRINEPGFGETAARQMERDVLAGMRGLKIYKALGLEYRHPDGTFWRVNDPALDPIWAAAGELGIPVLIHTADPLAFWEPVDERNFWNGVLYGEYGWWTYYRKDYPCPEALLGERNDVIARHPKTTFICPHVGSKSDCLDAAADDLDAFDNLYYDISARIPVMGKSPRWAAHSRQFLIDYQDRILFGTDMIYDDTNVPTGMQAQALYQPYEVPLDGADPIGRYIETSVEFFQSHLEFLQTDTVQTSPPFKRKKGGIEIHGVNLSGEVCEKILHANFQRLSGLEG